MPWPIEPFNEQLYMGGRPVQQQSAGENLYLGMFQGAIPEFGAMVQLPASESMDCFPCREGCFERREIFKKSEIVHCIVDPNQTLIGFFQPAHKKMIRIANIIR